jgi:predicted RNase H-like HicB family nuclease
MEIPVLIQKSRGGDTVRAYCPDLPGCSATAATEGEALLRLRHRVADYFTPDAAESLPPGTRRAVICI